MYRDGSVYDEIDKVIYQIYQDYDIRSFPIDAVDVCKKLGVALVPYSAFPEGDRWLLEKKSKQGFFVKESKELPPTIYYNDNFGSMGAIRFTIFHELKHYIYNDDNDEDDDLADYFARHFMGPTPYLMLKGLDSPNDIVSFCDMSMEAAINACSNILSRRNKYGMNLFDYEVSLIGHLEPVLMETFKYDILKSCDDE